MKLTAQDILIGGSTLLIVLIVLTIGFVMLMPPDEKTYANASEAKNRWMAGNYDNSQTVGVSDANMADNINANSAYAGMYDNYTCNGTSVIQDGFIYCIVGDA